MTGKFLKIFGQAIAVGATLIVAGNVNANEIFEKSDHRLCVAVAKYADQVFDQEWSSHVAGKIMFETHVAHIDGYGEHEDPTMYDVATSADYKLVDQLKSRAEFVKQFNKCLIEARSEMDKTKKEVRSVYKNVVWKHWRGNKYAVLTAD